jgi:DNA-binding transcriptional MerR regulator
MLMMNLANYNQFEREMIAERTRDALQHMKAQGVRLGHAPYGYEHGKERDERGRRQLVPIPKEQEVIAKIKALHAEKLSFTKIARRLNELGIPAKRGGRWVVSRVCTTLQREGAYKARTRFVPGPLRHDREAATEIALRLRAEGMSLNQIGMRLRKERLTPLRGGKWHAAQVAQLLRKPADRNAAARRACELRAQGMTLKEIGVRLAMEGFQREDGGVWYPSLVHALLASEEADSAT